MSAEELPDWKQGIFWLLKRGEYGIVDSLISGKKFETRTKNKGNNLLKTSIENKDIPTIKYLVKNGHWID
jgi:hypothetical protein